MSRVDADGTASPATKNTKLHGTASPATKNTQIKWSDGGSNITPTRLVKSAILKDRPLRKPPTDDKSDDCHKSRPVAVGRQNKGAAVMGSKKSTGLVGRGPVPPPLKTPRPRGGRRSVAIRQNKTRTRR